VIDPSCSVDTALAVEMRLTGGPAAGWFWAGKALTTRPVTARQAPMRANATEKPWTLKPQMAQTRAENN
jgi:hypothetical protein